MKLLPLLVTVAVSKRIVINTWPFVEANEAAWKVLAKGSLKVGLGPYKCHLRW